MDQEKCLQSSFSHSQVDWHRRWASGCFSRTRNPAHQEADEWKSVVKDRRHAVATKKAEEAKVKS
jgi:hypothetical protein